MPTMLCPPSRPSLPQVHCHAHHHTLHTLPSATPLLFLMTVLPALPLLAYAVPLGYPGLINGAWGRGPRAPEAAWNQAKGPWLVFESIDSVAKMEILGSILGNMEEALCKLGSFLAYIDCDFNCSPMAEIPHINLSFLLILVHISLFQLKNSSKVMHVNFFKSGGTRALIIKTSRWSSGVAHISGSFPETIKITLSALSSGSFLHISKNVSLLMFFDWPSLGLFVDSLR